ncbi:MAG: hypothetical protein IPO08_18685 [Xanthomonadales bacterium]|nr:hypothetical protein [Xanthomonadales bacterium]
MTQDVDTDAIEEARKARRRERDRARYAANPEKKRERKRARYAANSEKERERVRAWRAANPEKKKESDRVSREAARASDCILFARKEMLRKAMARARDKDLPFNLTIDDIGAPLVCPVLGIELVWSNKKWGQNSPSLDRLVPALGYVRGNVLVMSFRANALKNNATPHELRLVADFCAASAVNVDDTKEDSNDTEN